MNMAAINKNGFVVKIGDGVSILAKVVSVSGIGSLAQVTVQSPLDTGTYVIQANDASAAQHQPLSTSNNAPDTELPAVSINGKNYGKFYEDLTVLGVVTAISGNGQSAILTVLLKTSLTSIVTAAGNCSSEQRSSTLLP
jgi:hypothetical protein